MEIIQGEVELQFDLKPNGAVIRVNTAEKCILRICRVPRHLVFNYDGTVKDFIDITYMNKQIKG